MFYRCKSCGGNVTYNPDKKKMICESCGNEGEPELISQDKKHVCNNCGAEIEMCIRDSFWAIPLFFLKSKY